MFVELRSAPGSIMRLEPNPPSHENSFHEVWWDSSQYLAPKEKPARNLHELWQWMGKADEPYWKRPGDPRKLNPELAYTEGWRYVRPAP
jgi:hypothetical protein